MAHLQNFSLFLFFEKKETNQKNRQEQNILLKSNHGTSLGSSSRIKIKGCELFIHNESSTRKLAFIICTHVSNNNNKKDSNCSLQCENKIFSAGYLCLFEKWFNSQRHPCLFNSEPVFVYSVTGKKDESWFFLFPNFGVYSTLSKVQTALTLKHLKCSTSMHADRREQSLAVVMDVSSSNWLINKTLGLVREICIKLVIDLKVNQFRQITARFNIHSYFSYVLSVINLT